MPELTIDGRRVAFSEQGSGPAVVMLHAGAGSGKQWAKTAALLQDRFRIIAPDFWGFGGTEPWPADRGLTHDDQAQLVIEVVRQLHAAPIHLVGHSYGGGAAIRYLLARQEEVRSAVLIEPIAPRLLESAGEASLFAEYFAVADGFLKHAAAGRVDDAWRTFLDYRNGAGTWERLPEPSKERFRGTTANTVVGFHSNLDTATSIDDLRRIDVPVLMLCGEKTTLPDRRVAAIVHEHLPRGRFEVIPGAEHMSPLTHPAFVGAAILRHIDSPGRN